MGTQAVWDLLRRISDPEIPVLSIVDLGIVRGVQFDGDACVITITPTYSGCPAMDVISREVKTALHDEGIDNVRVDMQLSPAWTTDWMTDEGKRALASYGIAPPSQKVVDISSLKRRGVDEPVVACPLCHSTRTQLVSQFGSTSCKALYKCLDCREPFDYFKSH